MFGFRVKATQQENQDDKKDENPRRRTARSTAGQAPSRFGDRVPVSTPNRKAKSISNPASTRVSTPLPSSVMSSNPSTTKPAKMKTMTVFKTAGSTPSVSSQSTSTTIRRAALHAVLRAQKELSRIEEQEDDLHMQLERLEVENALNKVRRHKEFMKKSLEMQKMADEIEEKADEEESGNDSQQLSESENEREESEEENQPAPRPILRKKTAPRHTFVSPIAQPSPPPPAQASLDSFAQFSKSIADAILQVSQTSNGRQNENGNFNTLVGRQLGRDLPVFSGEPKQWTSFVAAYERTNEIGRFSDVENLQRLDKALKGKAKEAVQALMVSPKNIEQIMKILKRRFGQPSQIIENLIEELRAKQLKENDAESFIEYASHVEGLVATTEHLDRRQYLENPVLLKELVAKLPFHLALRWGDHVFALEDDQRFVTIRDFSRWFSRIADSINLADISKQMQAEKPKKVRRESVLATAVSTKGKPSKERNCLVCNQGDHWLGKCKKFEESDVDGRWEIIKKIRACFCCLSIGHPLKQCKKKKDCGIDNCKRPHHPSLHKREHPSAPPSSSTSFQTQEVLVNVSQVNENPRVILKVAPVKVTGPKGSIDTFALLDDGATASLIENSLANQLGLEGEAFPMNAKGIGAIQFEDINSRCVTATVRGRNCEEAFTLARLRTVSNLNLPYQSINIRRLREQWTHLPFADLASLKNAKPMILIGEDNIHLIAGRELVEGPRYGPMMTKTKLGWVLHGNNDKGRVDREYINVMVEEEDSLHNLVKSYWSLETLGVNYCASQAKSPSTLRAEEILKQTTKRISDRFETGLLWKYDDLQLPESKQMALKRLYSVEKKMDADQNYAAHYTAKINHMIQKGYAMKLTKEEAAIQHPRVWYLPHFGVTNPNKPNKLRIVTDAAAKSHGLSLNDHLLTGPDLFNSLHGVLFKFRQRRYAIGGDIREMFPQCKIRKEDSMAQRFLWRGSRRQGEPDVYEMTSMVFGAVSSPCSAQYVKNVNAEEFMDQFPRAAEAILKRHYMDDYYDSCDTAEEAIQLANDVIEVHKRGGFEICNWMSSSPEILRQIPPTLRSQTDKDIDSNGLQPERILGLHWNPLQDCFQFNLKFLKVPEEVINGSRSPTKREVLKTVMAIFDPMGFLSHYTIHMKILLQDIWRLKLAWDDQLPAEAVHLEDKDAEMVTSPLMRWKKWLHQLEEVKKISIPRCYFVGNWNASEISLHVFSDASKKAVSTVCYLRMEDRNLVSTAFIMGKSLVAPVRPMTIPKLELQAAVMSTRLALTVMTEHDLKIFSVHFWTDSRIVLHWLKKDARDLEVFVANRVGEIQESTNTNQWRWCPTKLNVADDGTRDKFEANLSNDCRWLNGPDFLLHNPTEWPEEPPTKLSTEIQQQGNRVEYINVLTLCEDDGFPDIIRFSSWSRLIRATAWTLRFIDCYVKKMPGSATLTAAELEAAENLWLKKAQRESFPTEIKVLDSSKKPQDLPRCSRILTLNPFLQDGILRSNSRLCSSGDLSEAVKFPAILDPAHPYTKLLIRFYHEKLDHQGFEKVVNELRQKYWILRIRVAVKSAYIQCQKCKIDKASPRIPIMAELPSFRVTREQRPFVQTGVDFFGPIEVTVGRHHEKRYGVLFTCLATRAVHIEVAADLSTDKTIMAIRRFIARRGAPTCLHSDNGTNFKGASNELRKSLAELDSKKIQESLQNICPLKPIQWKFIAARSPHMGGAWERLVRSIKTALYATLKERSPSEDVLNTLLCEAEHSVNSRPLTHVSLDPKDPEALTPNHFLIGSSSSLQPMGHFTDDDMCLRRQWRISQRLADLFWKRWLREYLPSLTKRTKWTRNNPSFKKGDMVILTDDNSPRNSWAKGLVTEVYPGKDGCVRVVEVRTNSGVYKRAVHKVIFLDVNPKTGTAGEDVDDKTEPLT